MKKLVAIVNDLSNAGRFANYVSQLATDLHCKVHLLYTVNPNSYIMGSSGGAGAATAVAPTLIQTELKTATQKLTKVAQQITANNNVIKVTASAEQGFKLDIIQQMLDNNKMDMLVIEGNETESYWTDKANVMDLINNLQCPIWVVPHGIIYKGLNKILYATDYNREDINNLKSLSKLTSHLKPVIRALHVSHEAGFDERLKKAGFQDMVQMLVPYGKISHSAIALKEGENVTEALVDYASTNQTQLIVLLKENRHFLDRIIHASSTRQVIEKSDQPVLVYHEKSNNNTM